VQTTGRSDVQASARAALRTQFGKYVQQFNITVNPAILAMDGPWPLPVKLGNLTNGGWTVAQDINTPNAAFSECPVGKVVVRLLTQHRGTSHDPALSSIVAATALLDEAGVVEGIRDVWGLSGDA
jgi:hypothetical protein